MKRFSTVRDNQRGSQSYMEKRRVRRVIEVTRRRRGESKRKRAIYLVNNSLCALHSLEPSERFTGLHREEKREGGDRGEQEEKGGNQKERDTSKQNIPKCSPQPGKSTEIHRIWVKRRGKEEIEVTWGKKRRVKRERE